MMTEAQQKLAKLKQQRDKLDKQIRSEAAKASAAERKRKERQKFTVGGAIISSLKNLNAEQHHIVSSILFNKLSNDDKELLSDVINLAPTPEPTPEQTPEQTPEPTPTLEPVIEALPWDS